MRHVVVDTNCLLRMIPLRSKYRSVWEAFLNEEYIICLSNDILSEYLEILTKFVDCAIVASADYLVSEDNHFNVLKDIPFPKVNVITLEQFQNDLQSNK